MQHVANRLRSGEIGRDDLIIDLCRQVLRCPSCIPSSLLFRFVARLAKLPPGV
jgi:hypothetical protein